MRHLIKNLIGSSMLMFILNGCSYRILDFTLISSKNIDFNKSIPFIKGEKKVKGSDMHHIIIFVPTGTISIKEALDKAIESTPGCIALLDGVIYQKSWWIPFIYGEETIIIEGLPLLDPDYKQKPQETTSYRKITLDKKGDVQAVGYLSPNDYNNLKEKVTKESQEIKFKRAIAKNRI